MKYHFTWRHHVIAKMDAKGQSGHGLEQVLVRLIVIVVCLYAPTQFERTCRTGKGQKFTCRRRRPIHCDDCTLQSVCV